MKLRQKSISIAIMITMSTGFAMPIIAAQGSESGQRNTTLGLGALSAYLLATQKNKLPGIIAAAGTIYSYTRLNHSIQQRHKARSAWNNRSYNHYGSNNNYAPHRNYSQQIGNSYAQSSGHHDNGRHLGWYKHNRSW